MQLQIDFWLLIQGLFALLVAFVTVAWIFGIILVRQFKGQLKERFDAVAVEMRERSDAEEKVGAEIRKLENDFLKWRGDMPIEYVRREDYVRGQSVIELKLDALFNELKNAQIQGKI